MVLLAVLTCQACALAAPPDRDIEALDLAIGEFHKALHSIPSHPLRGDSEKRRLAYRYGYLHGWRATIERVDVDLGDHRSFSLDDFPCYQRPSFREQQQGNAKPRREFTYRPTLAVLERVARELASQPSLENAYSAGWRDGYSQVIDFLVSANVELGDDWLTSLLAEQPAPNPTDHPKYRTLVFLQCMVPVIDRMNAAEVDSLVPKSSEAVETGAVSTLPRDAGNSSAAP